MPQVTLTVNGKQHTVAVEGRTLLVELLREKLSLTGTHVGCDTSQCGACVVHVDGQSVKSCTMLAVQANGANVTTIEALRRPTARCTRCRPCSGTSRPAMRLLHAGHVMAAIDLVKMHPEGLSERQIREGWKAICAAARATTTSSRPSPPRGR